MLDFFIFLLLKYTYVLAAILFLVKIFLFVKNKNKNWTISQFLFFNPTNIQFTPNAGRAKLKRMQNQLRIGAKFLF
jgi:hypothetical protein